MQNKEITFDNLPEAVSLLCEQISEIREMVSELKPATTEERTLIGIEEACEIVQKAKPTIYALVRKGLIPAYKRGKKLYFYKDELIQWIESGSRSTPQPSSDEILASMRKGIRNKPKSLKR